MRILRYSICIALVLCLVFGARLGAQSGSTWQVSIAPGVALGGRVIIGGVDRTIYAHSNLRVSGELAAGRLSANNLVCTALVGPCDLREVSTFAAFSIAATAFLLPGDVSPYLRAAAGAWQGNYAEVGLYESSRGNGAVLSGETGMRIRKIELGVGAYGLFGTVRGRVGVGTFVGRFRF
jgi:hypothetical protein